MSKIFEALNRGQGEIHDIALSSLETPATQESQPDAPDGAVLLASAIVAPDPAVLDPGPAASTGPLETLHSAPSSPERAPEKSPEKSNDPLNAEIRTVSLRISNSAPLLPFDGDHWEASEQYRIVRTRLQQHIKQPRMIVISSAGSGDGKSVSAINLAGALSLKTESRVLLVDADFRRSTIHEQLGLPLGPGLAEVLRGTAPLESALVHTEQLQNLYVLTAGESRSNPVELLDSSRWPALCARLRQMFRYVIVDSPPIAAVADYDLIQAACDGVIVVLRPDHTNRKLCMKSLELIPKEKFLGVLMNCVTEWFLGRYNSAYYYQGYTQYEKAR